MSPMYEYMCIGNYATVFDEIWQDDLTEMLSNLNRGGKDNRIPNSNLYWDPTAAKLKNVNTRTNRNRVIYSLQRYNENTLRYIPNYSINVIRGDISIK